MNPTSRFRNGRCVEWEIVRIYTGAVFEVWESTTKRAGPGRVRYLRKAMPEAEFQLMRVTQEIVTTAKKSTTPARGRKR